ncbi:hypothetical protein [Catenuloplanes japonicus]|uniref:hypothetical protein n=1 Tax=Catenuloplanes japonicus TaxID=33876 RepID=UPI000690312C|nr:hypothetical protein [Catenuloplanes japonicus]
MPLTAESSSFAAIALPAAALVLSSTAVGGLMTTWMSSSRDNANTRRQHYAEIVRVLVAWAEYPYRIRRRTSDEPEVLAALAEQGHLIQEQRAHATGWVWAESRAVSVILEECIRDLSITVGPACQEAWRHAPATTAAAMNLGDIGPRGVADIVRRLEDAIRYRFGIRRILPAWLALRMIRRQQAVTAGRLALPPPDDEEARQLPTS